MLECPSCQFRSREETGTGQAIACHTTAPMCPQCGTALHQHTCPQCGSDVPFSQITCGNCGAPVGKIWLTIISQPDLLRPEIGGSEAAERGTGSTLPIPALAEILGAEPDPYVAERLGSTPHHVDSRHVDDVTTPLSLPDTVASHLPTLDPQRRYQVLEPLQIIAVTGSSQELEGTVLDLQPLRLSPIELLIEEMQLMGQTVDFSTPGMVKAYVSQASNTLPDLAYAYLALHLQFPRAMPKLQDAWQENTLDWRWGLVLEDLSASPFLVSCWQDTGISVLQRLRWLEDMIELWEALTPWGATASLLNLANLRVDESKSLCLRRLHFQTNVVEQPGTLLANLWRSLMNFPTPASEATTATQLIHPELAVLERELSQRSLKTLTDLHQLLGDVIAELQQTAPELWFIPAATLTHLETLDHPPNRQRRGQDSPTALLPDQLIELTADALTDVGRNRQQNEDYFLVQQRQHQVITPQGQQVHCQGLFILCDGMGGHAEGEVASALAAKTLQQYFQQYWQEQLPGELTLKEGIEMANQAIHRLNNKQDRAGNGRMGTTLVMACVQDTLVRLAHVGDSRLYCFTASQGLEQLTIDHEVGQRDILRGVDPEIAYARPDAYQLTQALGPRDCTFIHPDIQTLEVDEDTLLLLCSDGLTDNNLLETSAQELLMALLLKQIELKPGLQELIDLANTQNGHDNITVIAVRMQVHSQLPLPL